MEVALYRPHGVQSAKDTLGVRSVGGQWGTAFRDATPATAERRQPSGASATPPAERSTPPGWKQGAGLTPERAVAALQLGAACASEAPRRT